MRGVEDLATQLGTWAGGGGERRGALADGRGLVLVRALPVDRVVAGVAGEMGDPVVGPGPRGGRVEVARVVVAVGADRVVGGVQRGQLLARAVGALVEVEADRAAARVDQAREGGDVGDVLADGRRGGGVGDQLGGGFVDGRGLVLVRALPVDRVVAGVAGEVGDPVVGPGPRGGRVEVARVVVAVGADRVVGGVQRGQLLARAVGALVEVEADRAAARVDQAREGGDVGDVLADGGAGGGVGDQLGGGFVDGRVLVRGQSTARRPGCCWRRRRNGRSSGRSRPPRRSCRSCPSGSRRWRRPGCRWRSAWSASGPSSRRPCRGRS